MRLPLFRAALGLSAIAGLTACVPSATVKDIAADKPGYLARNFTPQQLSPEITAALAKNEPVNLAFQTIRIKSTLVFEENGRGPKKTSVQGTYTNAGKGFVQEMSEFSSNDIPYRLHYKLSYLGLLPLRAQNVNLNTQTPFFPTEAKQLKQVAREVAQATEDREYVFEWSWGRSAQFANFATTKQICRSGKFYLASKLHARFAGNAVDLDCQLEQNGVLHSKQKYVALPNYGVVLLLEDQSSTYKDKYVFGEVEIL